MAVAAKQMLDLIDAHDIINEDQDVEVVLSYVEELQSVSMLENCSLKMLQSLLSSMNGCLHSKKSIGKLNGLIILQFVVQDCPDDIFNEHGANWTTLILNMLQKMQVGDGALRLLCSIVRTLVKRAPKFPDVSRYLTTVVALTNDALINISQKHGHLLNDCVSTISVLFKTYPGSCSSSISNVEKLLILNVKPDSKLNSEILAKCLSLIPRLGGGGKEGINHKANFVTMFQKLSFTLEDLQNELFKLSFKPNQKNVDSQGRAEEPLPLPRLESNDLLKRSLYVQRQFGIVADCLCALIEVPFPHYKSMRLGLILGILKRLFDQLSLNESAKMVGNEGKVLLLVLPGVMIASLKILRTLIVTCRKAAILLVPNIIDIIQTALADLRNFTESFTELKVQVYKVIRDVCDTIGVNTSLEGCHQDLVSYVLSDVLPQKQASTTSMNSHKKNKKNAFVPIKTVACKMDQALMRVALKTLTAMIKVMGTIMDESVHKQVQCVLISLGMEQECSKNRLETETRKDLYESLVALLAESHIKCQPPLQLLCNLFRTRSQNEQAPELRSICYMGLTLCQQKMHPSRASMHLDVPLDVKTVDEIRDDLMKVHVYYLETPSNNIAIPQKIQLNSHNGIENGNSNQNHDTVVDTVDDVVVENDAHDANLLADIKSCKEKLKSMPQEKGDSQKLKRHGTVEDFEDELSSHEENAKIAREAYNLEEHPIFIPENLKNRSIVDQVDEPTSKKPKMDYEQSNDEYLDAETMMKDFVPAML